LNINQPKVVAGQWKGFRVLLRNPRVQGAQMVLGRATPQADRPIVIATPTFVVSGSGVAIIGKPDTD
jgi:hypothetical protein